MLSPNVERALRTAIERNPDLADELESLAAWLSDALAQHHARAKPLGAHEDENRGAGRVKVRITRRGTRLLDVDNGAGGCKALLDAIRYENLIRDDNPGAIEFEFRQEKVKRPYIGTQIDITPL